jgi:hypothetical protein
VYVLSPTLVTTERLYLILVEHSTIAPNLQESDIVPKPLLDILVYKLREYFYIQTIYPGEVILITKKSYYNNFEFFINGSILHSGAGPMPSAVDVLGSNCVLPTSYIFGSLFTPQ